MDNINGIQNPLFGIVQSEYLQGLTEEDARQMIHQLGRRMGMRFDREAIKMLYNQYNGHPMLLRLACSYINRQYDKAVRPIDISLDDVRKIQESIDMELAFYFKHVVSEIKQFYIEEYEMFELLASGQIADFIELSSVSEYVTHLYSYGLIAKNDAGVPYVKMPVAGRYVALELARKENRKLIYKIIPKEQRAAWVSQRITSIIQKTRELERLIRMTSGNKLFGENSFPEADRFAQLGVVTTESDFEKFFNVCNRCFVESIENYGKAQGKNNYFWNEIKNDYPSLFEVLHRIKVYRHSGDHLVLNNQVANLYEKYWKEDTVDISDAEEQRFVIQQRILESFLTSLLQ